MLHSGSRGVGNRLAEIHIESAKDLMKCKDIDRVMDDQQDLVTIRHTLSQILDYEGSRVHERGSREDDGENKIMTRSSKLGGALVCVLVALGACASNDDSAGSESDGTQLDASTTIDEPTTTEGESSDSPELGTPVSVGIGTTVLIDGAVVRQGPSGPYLEATMVVDNSEQPFDEFDPDVALVCTSNSDVGRHLTGVEPTSGALFPIDTPVAAGATVTGTILLTQPIMESTGEPVTECSGQAAITVFDAFPEVTIRLPDDITSAVFTSTG